jgi:hypothetical protein
LSLSAVRPLEVVMTRRSPVRLLSGVAFLVLLSACAGSGTGVDPATDAAAAPASATDGSTGDPAAGTTNDGGPRDGNQGNPGAPGADPADGGGGGGVAQGNPGAPGDVAVFEEGGNAPYSALVSDASTTCAAGACTLLEPPIILDGNVDRVEGGVGECTIADKTDILYHPPAQGGRFPRGATVRAQVHCAHVETPVEEPAGGSPAAGDTTTSATADQPQGRGG